MIKKYNDKDCIVIIMFSRLFYWFLCKSKKKKVDTIETNDSFMTERNDSFSSSTTTILI